MIGERSSSARRRAKSGGFTLLEVMIALLIVAVGLGALIQSTGNAAWQSAYLRQKTIASWVAQNQIAIYRAKKIWDTKNRVSGVAEMSGAKWNWEMRISGTPDPSVRQLEIDVYLEDEEAIKSSMTAFIVRL